MPSNRDREAHRYVEQLGSLLMWRRRRAADALAALGPDACGPLLFAVIANPRLMGSTEARTLLHSLAYPEAVALLARLLCAPTASVGPIAADVLRRIGGPGSVIALIGGLSAPSADSHVAAVRALGMLGDPAAVGPLCRMLVARKATWHRPLPEIAAALGRIGDPRAVPYLLLPKLPFEEVRQLALLRIGRPGLPRLAEALDPAAGKDSLLAMRVIHQIGPDALPVLSPLCASQNRCVALRATVLEGLLAKPDPDRLPILLEALHDRSEGIAGLAVRAITRIAEGGFAHLLLPAVPAIRDLRARKWGNDAVRAACRQALQAIEEQKGSRLGTLPLPADGVPADTRTFPLPIVDELKVGPKLPVPSGPDR